MGKRIKSVVTTLNQETEITPDESEENLRNAYHYTRSLIEASLDPLVTINVKGKITDVNLATEKATGFPRNTLIGTDFSDYFTEPDKARIGFQKTFENGSIIDYPLSIRHTSNKIIDVIYNANVYYNDQGKVLGVFAAARDITERNRVKEKRASELIIANKELAYQNKEKQKRADELIIANNEKDKRVAELIIANEEKEKRASELIIANKELETFSYSVSHDLRAPLRHINGYVDLLLSRFYDTLPEKGRHYLDNIADSSRQMGTLIDDLLKFSRIGRQEKRLVDLDMNIIVHEVLVSVKHDNPERNIEWQIATLPQVYGDKALLHLVWTNLLSNAVKFTRTREKSIIEVNFLDENNSFIFSIHDNGVGFDMQYAHKLFGVFQRLHPTDEFEGTGIGLANVQHIILRHRGRTWAEAEPDKGATFYFSLPKNKET
jgi:PAS domain S-box-containing protein